METILLIGIVIATTAWIIRKENRKLKNICGSTRTDKAFSEEYLHLPEHEKYGCYKLAGMQYRGLKQSDYGIHHCHAIAESAVCGKIVVKREDNEKVIACITKEGSKELHDFIIRNGGKVPALYYIWKYGQGEIYGCAYVRDK